MITLYAASAPNPVKVLIALEELELPYEVVPVDVMRGAQFDPEVMRLNPNGKVPIIIDHDGPGGRAHTAFESGAILLYLADKTGRLIPQEPGARSEATQWLMVQMSTLGPMFGQFIHFMRFAPPNEYALARYRTQVRRLLEVYEGRLKASEWLGGAEYSVADIATFPWLRFIKAVFGPEVDADYPSLMAWTARIADRPAVKRADAARSAIASQEIAADKAAPETIDRMMGRGAYARA